MVAWTRGTCRTRRRGVGWAMLMREIRARLATGAWHSYLHVNTHTTTSRYIRAFTRADLHQHSNKRSHAHPTPVRRQTLSCIAVGTILGFFFGLLFRRSKHSLTLLHSCTHLCVNQLTPAHADVHCFCLHNRATHKPNQRADASNNHDHVYKLEHTHKLSHTHLHDCLD